LFKADGYTELVQSFRLSLQVAGLKAQTVKHYTEEYEIWPAFTSSFYKRWRYWFGLGTSIITPSSHWSHQDGIWEIVGLRWQYTSSVWCNSRFWAFLRKFVRVFVSTTSIRYTGWPSPFIPHCRCLPRSPTSGGHFLYGFFVWTML